jgi:hypothetical protein
MYFHKVSSCCLRDREAYILTFEVFAKNRNLLVREKYVRLYLTKKRLKQSKYTGPLNYCIRMVAGE